jgi:hypothetical protein
MRHFTIFATLTVSVWLVLSASSVAQTPAPQGNNKPTLPSAPAIPPPTLNTFEVSARNIVRLAGSCPTNAANSCTAQLGSPTTGPYTVPKGKRLVIRGISAEVVVPTGDNTIIDLRVPDHTYGYDSFMFPELHRTNWGGWDIFVANSTAADFYVDQGNSVMVDAATDNYFIIFGLYAWGYLVDCGTAGCTAG